MTNVNQPQIQAWLRKRMLWQCTWKLSAALALVLIGAGVLLLTYWFVIGFWYFVFVRFGLSAHPAPFVAGAFLVLLFIGNARTDREYLSDLSVTTGTFSNQVVTFYLPGVGMASNVNPLAPDTMHSSVKMITTLLFTGPRALVAAFRCLRTAIRIMRMDIGPVATVIAFLYGRPGRADFQTIVANVPDLNPVQTFPQVTQIEGILLLSNEPAGLTIGSGLRKELDEALQNTSQGAP